MSYVRPEIREQADATTFTRGIGGKITLRFIDMYLPGPLFGTLTAGTPGAYQSDE